jgi:sterol desaturase/sphingolipid hydroxylase (fatty acid hydroxylase superfamily)
MEHVRQILLAEWANGTLVAVLLLWATVIGSVLVAYRMTFSQLVCSVLPYIKWTITLRWSQCWRSLRESRLGTILDHPSSRADFLFFVSRRLTFVFYTVPAMFSAAWVGTKIHGGLAPWLPTHHTAATPLLLLAFTVTMFLAYDIAYYWYHWLQHHVLWMWHLHKVHHSAEVLVGVTKDRVHPIDYFMNHMWNAMTVGLMFAFWSFFMDDPVELTILGVNVYTLRNILMMDFVRHTHLGVSFGWLNEWVICPHYHQLHHSTNPKHYNKNFGLALAIWDRMFGTFAVPEPNERFQYGLSDNEHDEYQSMLRLYIVPILKICRLPVPENHRSKGEHANAI